MSSESPAESESNGPEAAAPGASQSESATDEAGESEPPELDPLEEAERKLSALKDQLLRTLADFDNFRKRARREQEDANQAGREGMLKDLLPVFDNLERATAHADAATDVASLVSGIQMVSRQFVEALKRGGVERVTAVGVVFDPSVHEAIQQLETREFPAGSVAAEVQAGYRLGERLIRPALVVVARAPADPAPAPLGDEGEAAS